MISVYDYVKAQCCGCESCSFACPTHSIEMVEDAEGFRYPVIDQETCIDCNRCKQVCPLGSPAPLNPGFREVYGGHIKDNATHDASTSGGVFSAIIATWCDSDTAIFGVESRRLETYHSHVIGPSEATKYRKSKYVQSHVEDSYAQALSLLKAGRRVLFSGTPCQVAALYNYPGIAEYRESGLLLSIDVVCEGFPSPLLLRKHVEELEAKHGKRVVALDYRYKDGKRWDFQVMLISFEDGTQVKTDRWFSPFWIFWSDRLMSRPSCISCPFRTPSRPGDITLGDLWGSQAYCPELYCDNSGASVVTCNSALGQAAFQNAKPLLSGHALDAEQMLAYQRPLRVKVPASERRDAFMADLASMSYSDLCRKWQPKSSFKVLFSKYVFGSNKQKVDWWKFKQRFRKRNRA